MVIFKLKVGKKRTQKAFKENQRSQTLVAEQSRRNLGNKIFPRPPQIERVYSLECLAQK